MTKNEDLKALLCCPFCGAKAWRDCSAGGQFNNVCCTRDLCGLSSVFMSERDWNTRPTVTPTDGNWMDGYNTGFAEAVREERFHAQEKVVGDPERALEWVDLYLFKKDKEPQGGVIEIVPDIDNYDEYTNIFRTIRTALQATRPCKGCAAGCIQCCPRKPPVDDELIAALTKIQTITAHMQSKRSFELNKIATDALKPYQKDFE